MPALQIKDSEFNQCTPEYFHAWAVCSQRSERHPAPSSSTASCSSAVCGPAALLLLQAHRNWIPRGVYSYRTLFKPYQTNFHLHLQNGNTTGANDATCHDEHYYLLAALLFVIILGFFLFSVQASRETNIHQRKRGPSEPPLSIEETQPHAGLYVATYE